MSKNEAAVNTLAAYDIRVRLFVFTSVPLKGYDHAIRSRLA